MIELGPKRDHIFDAAWCRRAPQCNRQLSNLLNAVENYLATGSVDDIAE